MGATTMALFGLLISDTVPFVGISISLPIEETKLD
jgi:hypothetical protein